MILRDNLLELLRDEFVSENYCLLDVPNYCNAGDHLILEGEYCLVRAFGKRIRYTASLDFFDSEEVRADDCILLQGGGNFGDLYRKHQDFREYIVERYPNNKIIIFPSTIYFRSLENLKRTAEIFSRHPKLTICARDNVSYEILKEHFPKNTRYLVPDSAFAIDYLKSVEGGSKKVLLLLRKDKEKVSSANFGVLRRVVNLEILDWDEYQNFFGVTLYLHAFVRYINKTLFLILKIFGVRWPKAWDNFGSFGINSSERYIANAIRLLSRYDFVITTRLHGCILACLLGIPNILLNNSYSKNKNFHAAWLKGGSFDSYYADSPEEAIKIMRERFAEMLIES